MNIAHANARRRITVLSAAHLRNMAQKAKTREKGRRKQNNISANNMVVNERGSRGYRLLQRRNQAAAGWFGAALCAAAQYL